MTAEQMKYEFDVGYDKITNFDAPGYEPKEISTFLTRAQEIISLDILDSSAFDEKNKKAVSRLRQVIPLTTFTAGNYPNGFRTPLQISVGGANLEFTADNILDDSNDEWIINGFRVGDVITITGDTPSNNGVYSVIGVTADELTVSPQTLFTDIQPADSAALVTTDPVLRVRNERADIKLGTTNFYYARIPAVVPATNPVSYVILDVKVNPTDDDFYSANKDNPYKKPSIEKIWRIDSADDSQKEHEYITDGTFTINTIHLHIDRKPRPIIVPDAYIEGDDTIDGVYFADYIDGLDSLLDSIIHRTIVDLAIKLAYAALQDEKGVQISSVLEQQK